MAAITWLAACGQPAGTPTPSAPADPPVTADLSGITVARGRLLFEDGFLRPDSGWETFADAQARATYSEGEFEIEIPRAPLRVWSVLSALAAPADVTLSVTGYLASGPASGGYGLVCRFTDADHFYFFALTGAGEYIIGKHIGASFIGLTGPKVRASTAILTSGLPNLITAQCHGDRLSLSVNTMPVAEVSDAALTEGQVGLFAVAAEGEALQARFDNFTLYAP